MKNQDHPAILPNIIEEDQDLEIKIIDMIEDHMIDDPMIEDLLIIIEDILEE